MYKQKLLDAMTFLYSFNESLVQFEEDFLDKEDKIKIKLMKKINPNSLEESAVAYTKYVLEKYKDEIENNYDIDFINNIDCLSHSEEKEKNVKISFKDNKLEIVSDIPNNSKLFDFFCDKKNKVLDLNSLFILLDDVIQKNVSLKRASLKNINKYISSINYDEIYVKNITLPNISPKFSFLREFQKIGVLFNILNKNTILGDEMGLGKTVQAICSSYMVTEKDTLLICSSSLKYVLKNQVEKFFDDIDVFILGKDEVFKSKNRRFFVINYESIHNYKDIIENSNIDVVIFDEIHLIKNAKAIRTKNTLNMVKGIEYKFGLSGTSILNKPVEMASQIEAIGALQEFGGFWGFMEKYCPEESDRAVNQNFKSKKVFSEERNRQLGSDIREVFYLRRNKKEVAKEIPEKQRTLIPIEITNRSKYERAYSEYQLLKESSDSVSRSHLGKKLAEINKILADGKVEAAIQMISLFVKNNEKLVVFCHHSFIKEKIISYFPKALHIFQEDSPEERFNAEKEFQSNKDKNLIILTIRTGYAGYTLDKSTNVLFVEFDPCPSINEQAEDRVHRLETKDVVNAWYLYAKNTREEIKLNNIKDKADMIKLANKNENEESFDLRLEEDIIENNVFNLQ